MRLSEMIYTEEEMQKLREENKKLKEELDFFKEQAILWRNDWKVAYEEKRKLKSDLGTVIYERDNAFKKIKQLEERLDNKEKVNKSLREDNKKLKEDIDNGFNRETDLRNKRADSLLENKDLRDKIEELETDYDRLKIAFEDVVSGN